MNFINPTMEGSIKVMDKIQNEHFINEEYINYMKILYLYLATEDYIFIYFLYQLVPVCVIKFF